MNIFNKLKISYEIESKIIKKKRLKFSFLVDGEEILMKNTDFWQLKLDDQLSIVNSFIENHNIKLKSRKRIFNQLWEEVKI